MMPCNDADSSEAESLASTSNLMSFPGAIASGQHALEVAEMQPVPDNPTYMYNHGVLFNLSALIV